jgi:hypothetical protein
MITNGISLVMVRVCMCFSRSLSINLRRIPRMSVLLMLLVPLRKLWIWGCFPTSVITETPGSPRYLLLLENVMPSKTLHTTDPIDPQGPFSVLLFLESREQALSPGRGEGRSLI